MRTAARREPVPGDALLVRNHGSVDLVAIGAGPRTRKKGFDDLEIPRCRPGDHVDVLLDDGRIVRTRIRGNGGVYCGTTLVEGVHGTIHVSRVRACGAWTGVKGCSYFDGGFR